MTTIIHDNKSACGRQPYFLETLGYSCNVKGASWASFEVATLPCSEEQAIQVLERIQDEDGGRLRDWQLILEGLDTPSKVETFIAVNEPLEVE